MMGFVQYGKCNLDGKCYSPKEMGRMDMVVSIVGYVTEFTIQKDAFKSM